MPADISKLPISTLALLNAHFGGDLGAATARVWADDILTAGLSSDTLVEMALLSDHEWGRARELLRCGLNDAGIITEPSWQLSLTFFRLLIQAFLDRRLATGEFSHSFEQAYNFGPSREDIPEAFRLALGNVFDAVAMYSTCGKERAEYPGFLGDEEIRRIVAGAARQLAG